MTDQAGPRFATETADTFTALARLSIEGAAPEGVRMVDDELYSLSELVEKERVDAGAVRRAIAKGNISAYVELADAIADWPEWQKIVDEGAPEFSQHTHQTAWSRWKPDLELRHDSRPIRGLKDYVLDGWFQVTREGGLSFAVGSRDGLLIEPCPRPEWFVGCFVLELDDAPIPELLIHVDDLPRVRKNFAKASANKSNPGQAEHLSPEIASQPEDLPLSDNQREALQKQIGVLALLLAEKSKWYKRGDTPNASQIAESAQEIIDALPEDKNRLGTGNSSLRKNIAEGIKLLNR